MLINFFLNKCRTPQGDLRFCPYLDKVYDLQYIKKKKKVSKVQYKQHEYTIRKFITICLDTNEESDCIDAMFSIRVL